MCFELGKKGRRIYDLRSFDESSCIPSKYIRQNFSNQNSVFPFSLIQNTSSPSSAASVHRQVSKANVRQAKRTFYLPLDDYFFRCAVTVGFEVNKIDTIAKSRNIKNAEIFSKYSGGINRLTDAIKNFHSNFCIGI